MLHSKFHFKDLKRVIKRTHMKNRHATLRISVFHQLIPKLNFFTSTDFFTQQMVDNSPLLYGEFFKLMRSLSSLGHSSRLQTTPPGTRYCLGAASRWYNARGATCGWHVYWEAFVCDHTSVAGFSFPDIMELFTLVGSQHNTVDLVTVDIQVIGH